MSTAALSSCFAAPLRVGVCIAAAGLLCAGGARADIWGYVDAQGLTHFAQQQLDARYRLYARGSDFSFDAQAVLAAGGVGVRALHLAPADPTQRAQRLAAQVNRSAAYKALAAHMQQQAQRHAIDVELLKAVATAESGFQSQAVSPAGAVGLMQIMPQTARHMGLVDRPERSVEQQLLDAVLNLGLGARHLRGLLNQFGGRLDLALAAYNAGAGAVQRAGGAVPPYAETQNYVRTVLALYEAFGPGAVGRTPTQGAPRRARLRMTITASAADAPASSPLPALPEVAPLQLPASAP